MLAGVVYRPKNKMFEKPMKIFLFGDGGRLFWSPNFKVVGLRDGCGEGCGLEGDTQG